MGNIADSKILEACRKVELAAARLYHLFAKLHVAEAGMAALWLKTAREEENHARQVEMVLRRRVQMGVDLRIDGQQAESALELLETITAEAMLRAPSTRQALEEAITLENTLMQFHADYAVTFQDESYQKLFRSMMAADRDHVGSLQAALDNLAQRA